MRRRAGRRRRAQRMRPPSVWMCIVPWASRVSLRLGSLGVNCRELVLANKVNLKSLVFGCFVAKPGPETHLDRPGSSYSADCTENQPWRPPLGLLRGPFATDSKLFRH